MTVLGASHSKSEYGSRDAHLLHRTEPICLNRDLCALYMAYCSNSEGVTEFLYTYITGSSDDGFRCIA